MKVGLSLPQTADRGAEGGSWSQIERLARLADDGGADSVWVADHFFYRDESVEIGLHEAFTLLTAVAAVTTRVHVGPLVAATSFRSPGMLAKIATTLDSVADGRLILGLGCGWHEAEYGAFGYPFDHRVSRFEEAIQIIAALLREGEVDFHGKYYQARACILRPRGPSPAGPPIWVGTRGDRMLRIAARHADAYNAIWPITAAQVAAQRARMLAACRDAGRDPATLDLTVGTFVHLPENGRPVADDHAISGTYHEIAAQLRAFAELGVRHVIVDLRPDISIQAIEEFGRVLELMR
jgi:probable F420-dependent oxidoreductase